MGLRGLAALIVLISHCAGAGMLPDILTHGMGQMGVTAFYGLSGFLLGHLYLTRPCSAAEMRRYAVHRVARVLPLFYVCVFLVALTNLIAGTDYYSMGSLPAFLGNALLVYGTGVFWSIPVEIHYYIVFVAIWYFYHRRRQSGKSGLGALAVTMGVALIMLFLALLVWTAFRHATEIRLFCFLPFWAPIFLFGTILSQIRPGEKAMKWTLIICVTLALVMLPIAPPELRRMLGLPVLPNFIDPITAGLPLVFLILTVWQIKPLRFLGAAPFRWLGSVSFCLYLVHPAAILLIESQPVLMQVPGLAFLCVFLLSCAVSELSRRMFERPAQRLIKTWIPLKGVALPRRDHFNVR